MSQRFHEYSRQLALCTMTYQFIELSLRFCLLRCHATVQFRLEGLLPYEAPFRAIQDAAMGRLIDWYKIFTTNTTLIEDLRSIKGERDRIAHQGYILTLKEQDNDAFLIQETQKLEAAEKRANACLEALKVEGEKTDEVVNRVYAELRSRRSAEGTALPATPTIHGVTDSG
jgi:hypothetical protein